MKILTPRLLTDLRDALDGRLQQLRAEIDAVVQVQRELTGASEHEVKDRKDDAALRQLSDLGGVQEQRDFDEMAEVEAALQRLDGGTYGDCLDCAEPISLQRLHVQPAALRCAPCQVAHEHALHRPGSRTASS